jgi:hypothetical protein
MRAQPSWECEGAVELNTVISVLLFPPMLWGAGNWSAADFAVAAGVYGLACVFAMAIFGEGR